MRLHPIFYSFCLILLLNQAFASQVQPRTFISPITNKPFEVKVVPFDPKNFREEAATSPANMGIDTDGCRHHSGFSEYDHYIVCCPFSFFAASAYEWNDRSGRFTSPLKQTFVDWLRSGRGLNTDWITTRNRKYKTAQAIARAQKKPIGPVTEYIIPQDQISIERKYNYAMRCYAQRQARDAFMAKIALTGAWAVRVHLNRQLSDPDLEGGIKEVNSRIDRHIDEGEEFNLKKWLKVYRTVFKSSQLSDEGYFIAGSTLLGLELRDGGYKTCDQVLDAMDKRFKDLEHGEKLRGIVRERRRMLDEYRKLLDAAVVYFAKAIANEEIRRDQLPTTMRAVAEGLRRTNHISQAIDWYLAIDNMDETDPNLRKQIRDIGKAPAPHAPFLVHVGWQAHLRAVELAKEIPGRELKILADASLLNAIVNENLGSSKHKNPHWQPVTGAAVEELNVTLGELGKALIDYEFRLEQWPGSLGQLWDDGAIPDWNRFNRFHCPVTGAAFKYAKPKAPRTKIPAKTVLIACTRPVQTAKGAQYLNYLANNSLVWSDQPLQVNSRAP